MTPSVTSVESSEQFWSKIRQIWRICEPCTNDENLSFDFLCLYKPSTTLSSIKLVNVKDSSSPIVSQLSDNQNDNKTMIKSKRRNTVNGECNMYHS